MLIIIFFGNQQVHSSFYDLHMTNTNMSTESSDVHGQIEEVLGSYMFGLPLLLDWSSLERSYWLMSKKSLPGQPLGVKNLEDLLGKMGNMLVVFEKNKKKWVMSARMVETRLKYLKRDVQDLLRRCGEIKFDSFEDVYKNYFQFFIKYYYYV